MGNDPNVQEEQDRAKQYLRAILANIKSGTASPGDVALARDINQTFFAGAYTEAIEAAEKIAQEKMAVQKTQSVEVKVGEDSVADTKRYFSSAEMQNVLDVNKNIASGKPSDPEAFKQSFQSSIKKSESGENTKLLENNHLERKRIMAQLKKGPHKTEDLQRYEQLLKDSLNLQGVQAQADAAKLIAKQKSISLDDVLSKYQGELSKETKMSLDKIEAYNKREREGIKELGKDREINPRGVLGTAYIDPPRATPKIKDSPAMTKTSSAAQGA